MFTNARRVFKHATLLASPLAEWAKTGSTAFARPVIDEANKLLVASRAVEEKTEDVRKKKLLKCANDRLKVCMQNALLANKALCEDPTNPLKKAKFIKALRDLESAKNAVVGFVYSPESGVSAIIADCVDDFAEGGAALLKDPIKAKAIFENLGAKTNHLFDVLEAYADLIENPEERRVFKEKLEKLKCMNDELIRLGLAAANDPKNQKLIDEYNRKYKEYIKALESIVPPEKLFAGLHLCNVAKCDHLISVATNPTLSKEQKLKEAQPLIEQLERDMVMQTKVAKEFAELITDKQKKEALLKTIEREQKSDAELRKEREEEEKRKLELTKRYANEFNDLPDGQANVALYSAAVMMKHGLNGTIPASVANAKKLNEALTLGHNLAKLLAELAFSYGQNDMQSMLKRSKDIAVVTRNMIALSTVVKNACGDPKLADEIRIHAEAVENYTIRLKLMSAMKAASDVNDSTSEEQLVCAGEGLAREATLLVNAITAAGLHKSVREKVLA